MDTFCHTRSTDYGSPYVSCQAYTAGTTCAARDRLRVGRTGRALASASKAHGKRRCRRPYRSTYGRQKTGGTGRDHSSENWLARYRRWFGHESVEITQIHIHTPRSPAQKRIPGGIVPATNCSPSSKCSEYAELLWPKAGVTAVKSGHPA